MSINHPKIISVHIEQNKTKKYILFYGEKIFMKKSRLKITALILTLSFILSLFYGCNNDPCEKIDPTQNPVTKSSRNVGGGNNSRTFSPKDFICASSVGVQQKKAYTILIYMNGSDLETEYAAATEDLFEMLDSRFDDENINLIIFTGGAKKWHIDGIPNKDNAIFKMTGGGLEKLAQVGKDPMGYPETLSGFINFGCNLFPAEQYGLVFWNHGGGAIVGYGHDERFENPDKSMMKLSEIDSALGGSDLCKNGGRFDFIGFDTCLMATLEMACIAAKYSDYLIASEELEPEGGWDYTFLGDIYPGISGADAGKSIAKHYADFYINSDIEDIITISVTDLSKINAVANAFEKLASAGRNEIANGNFTPISRARSFHRSFGSRGEYNDETDMIDAANLAKSLRHLFPEESNALISAMSKAVIYRYETNIEELGGLSVYFPFANKDDLNYYMKVYKSINQLPEYVDFIDDFRTVLDSEPFVNYRGISNVTLNREDINIINPADSSKYRKLNEDYRIVLSPEQLENLSKISQTTWKKSELYGRYIQISETAKVNVKDDGTVDMNFSDDCATLNGKLVCLYETAPLKDGARYAIPIKLNGDDADLIAVYNARYPDGKIIGAVPSGESVYDILDKKVVHLRHGDKIQILYYSEPFGKYTESSNNNDEDKKSELWQKGEEFTINSDGGNDLILKKEPLENGEYIYGLNFVDLQQNKYYSNFLSVGIE